MLSPLKGAWVGGEGSREKVILIKTKKKKSHSENRWVQFSDVCGTPPTFAC